MPDRVDEILEKLYEEGNFEGEHREIHPDRIREAKSSLLKVVCESIPNKFGHVPTLYENGYNDAIMGVIKSMKEVFDI